MIVQGTASAAATSVAIPAHQPGDMILIFARGTAAAPGAPAASGNVPTWIPTQSAFANSIGLTSRYCIATSSTHTTGTWTSATHICVLVLRADAGNILGYGGSSTGNGTAVQTIVYPALTLTDADGSSWGVRCGTRATAVTAVGTPPTGWTNQIVQPAGASALMSVHTQAGITSNPGADTVSTAGSNAAYRAHTIEITEGPGPTPTYETSIDDFNRADGLLNVGAGSSIWTLIRHDGGPVTDLRVISNQLGSILTTYQTAITKKIFGPDCDILIDCGAKPVDPNQELGIYFNMINPATATFSCYTIFYAGSTNLWLMRRYLNGVSQGNIITATAVLNVGDSIWVYKRGSTIRLYKKSSSGAYLQIMQGTDANHTAPGVIVLELSDATQRWDNVRGGPIYVPPSIQPVVAVI